MPRRTSDRRTMKPEEYQKAIAHLGLNQREAADWLGISHRSSQAYALGESKIPIATGKLLRVCYRLGLTTEQVDNP